MILITVEPTTWRRPSPAKAAVADCPRAGDPGETLQAFAAAVGEAAPVVAPELTGDPWSAAGLFWRRGEHEARRFDPWPSDTARRRHRRKYAEGDLGDCSFYFRGPRSALNLRAPNLQVFAELAAGVDEETWEFHLRRGDIARWLTDCVKDPELADVVEGIAGAADLDAADSRRRVIDAINGRYTAPA